jgi:putative transposase
MDTCVQNIQDDDESGKQNPRVTWRASSHAKDDCKYHLIWCPKRRRPHSEADGRASIRETFQAIAEEVGFWSEELALEEDHVHVVLECPPKYAIARVVGILKSISASRTFQQCPWLRRKYWSSELWEDGYAVRTGGDRVTADLSRRYIKRHTEEQATNQPELF